MHYKDVQVNQMTKSEQIMGTSLNLVILEQPLSNLINNFINLNLKLFSTKQLMSALHLVPLPNESLSLKPQ